MIFALSAALFAFFTGCLTRRELKGLGNMRACLFADIGVSLTGLVIFITASVYAETVFRKAEAETAEWARDMLALDMSVIGLYAVCVVVLLALSSLLSLAEKDKGRYSGFSHTARVISAYAAPILLCFGVYFFGQISYSSELSLSGIVYALGLSAAMMMRMSSALEVFLRMRSHRNASSK